MCISRQTVSLRFAFLIAVLLLLSASSGVASVASLGPSDRPNIVVLLPDDLSWDDFSYYSPDGPRTPEIDSLIRTGVRLTDFHVSPTCSPSRAALLTGRYNNATGVWHTILGRYFLRASETTLADICRANGYRTAIFGKWHLGDLPPFRPGDRGFEHTAMLLGGGIDQQHNPWGNRDIAPAMLQVDGQPIVMAPGNVGASEAYTTDFFTSRALDFISTSARQKKPFFSYIAYNIAHEPTNFPPKARAGVDAKTATIENLDHNIGRVLRHLESVGIADDTIVIFLTDNGMASRRFAGAKSTPLEGGHRVPCVVRWPRGGVGALAGEGGESPGLAAHIDLLPTLLDFTGMQDLPRPPHLSLHGKSLRQELQQTSATHPPHVARTLAVDNQRMDRLQKYRQAAVLSDEVDGKGRMIRKWRLTTSATPGRWTLHDVLNDPKQTRDLVSEVEYGSVVARLCDFYEQWWQTVAAGADEIERPVFGPLPAEGVCLYSHDWHVEGMVPWNHTMVAGGYRTNGFHAVQLAQACYVQFELRRWPRELAPETSLTSVLHTPIQHHENNRPYLGLALPIAAGRLLIRSGGSVVFDERVTAGPEADAITFTTRLPAGPADIESWFYDASGREIAGAYYIYLNDASP